MPKITIMMAERFVRINDEPMAIPAEAMPDADLDLILDAAERPIRIIHFDGVIGTIERTSRVAGRVDTEHFLGAGPLQPFIDAHAAEKARQAAERKARDDEAERLAAESQKHFETEAAESKKPAPAKKK